MKLLVKDEYWDNWGRLVKVFCKGDICKGTLRHNVKVLAESPYYPGVSDYVDLNCIEIL